MQKNKMLCQNISGGWFASRQQKAVGTTYLACLAKLAEIVDSRLLTTEQKNARLKEAEECFLNYKKENRQNEFITLGRLMSRENLSASLFLEILEAYESLLSDKTITVWDEFLALNRKFASPIARFWMALYNENPSSYLPAENLWTILRILDILAQVKEDISLFNRFYLPRELLQQFGALPNDFALSYTPASVTAVMADIMSRLDAMQADSAVLPFLIKNKRLRMKIGIMLSLTNCMIKNTEKGCQPNCVNDASLKDKITSVLKGLWILCFNQKPQGRVL